MNVLITDTKVSVNKGKIFPETYRAPIRLNMANQNVSSLVRNVRVSKPDPPLATGKEALLFQNKSIIMNPDNILIFMY